MDFQTPPLGKYRYDLFLSHASGDKSDYVEPLAHALDKARVSYWLDAQQVKWGDSVAGRINQGLRTSRFGVICLSERFMKRPWPESELDSLLSMQNRDGRKRVLPLILNSADSILDRYPLLAGLAYREYSHDPDAIAGELAEVVRKPDETKPDTLQIIVASIHNGRIKNLHVSRWATLGWLIREAMNGLGVRDMADAGAPFALPIRWALVDAQAEEEWQKKPRAQQRRIMAMIATKNGIETTRTLDVDLDRLGIYDGMVCHLYAFEDEARLPVGLSGVAAALS
jgi:hypothetical protein